MTDFIRQYLCCCLPRPAPIHDTERQPLLDPDVLPQAPPRAPPTRTTEEQEAEQNLRRRILDQASERLINILSPNPFTSCSTSSSSSGNVVLPSQLSPPPPPRGISSNSSSLSSSPTLTSSHHHENNRSSSSSSRRRHRSRSSKRRHHHHSNSNQTEEERIMMMEEQEEEEDNWRISTNDPIAPVRVVHLGKNWQEIDRTGKGDLLLTPSTMRRQQRRGGGGGGGGVGKGRPPSSHSMRTLPSRGGGSGGGSNQPSPLRGPSIGGTEPDEEEEEEEEESRSGTGKSYRTAQSSSGNDGTTGGSRIGLRDIWGTAIGGGDEEEEMDPRQRGELEKALKQLEDEVDSFKIKDVGPIVADLAEYKLTTK